MPTTVETVEEEQESRQHLSLEQRSRSVPYRQPYVVAVLFTLLFYLSLVGFLTTIVAFSIAPPELQRSAGYILAAMLPACGFFWVVAYFKRRKAACPLCKCTPFLDNLAHKHQKAYKVRPFNYGTTAIFNVVLTQRWRCMYCGTPFDILKSKVKPD